MQDQPVNQTNSAAPSIDFGEVLMGILRRSPWIIIATVLAFVGSVAFVMVTKPDYTSEARVLVENLEPRFTQRNLQRQGGQGQIGPQQVKSQVEVVLSRDLAKKVISDLNLTSLDEFDSLKRGGPGAIKSFLIGIGFAPDPRKQSPEQRALDAYYKRLTAYQIPESQVIAISFRSKSPKTATDIANKLSEEFVLATRKAQSLTTSRERDFLAKQIGELRKKVVASELAVEKFRARAGLLKGRDQNGTLSRQELSELNSQIILAEAQRAQIQARAKAIREQLARTGTVESSSEVLNSPLIQRLRERQITLRGNLADLSATYLPNHPRMRAVRREIAGLSRQIRSEALKIVAGLDQQARVAAAREASLRASLNGLKTRESGNKLDEVKLRALEREAKANRTLLETFLSKFSDASTRDSLTSQPGKARVISRADVPVKPSFPKPIPTVLLATAGGFVLSLGIAFMASVMASVSQTGGNRRRETVRVVPSDARGADIAANTIAGQMPVMDRGPLVQPVQASSAQPSPPQTGSNVSPNLAPTTQPVAPPSQQAGPVSDMQFALSEPKMPSISQLPVSNSLALAAVHAQAALKDPQSGYAIGLQPVTAWVNTTRQTLGARKISVVGMPGADLDTAASALGLSRLLSAQGLKVILVDAAMQSSHFAAMTNTANLPGLADLLTGHASFMDVIVRDDVSDARILRLGKTLAAAWPLMRGERMDTVFAALENDGAHDVIVVYGGILGSGAMVQNGAVAKSQASLLIVPPEQISMAGSALSLLASAGVANTQYVRLESDHDKARPQSADEAITMAQFAAAQNNVAATPAPQPVMANQPLFPKVAV